MTERCVVVGIDQSAASEAALRWAADYGRRTGARVNAYFVQPEWVAGFPYAIGIAGVPLTDPTAWNEMAWSAALEMFRSVQPDSSWTIDKITHGSPGPELVQAARDVGAELLVVGTGEHTGLSRILEGSVSHYCLNHANIPVVAVAAICRETGGGSPRPSG